jgi:hypothetical protein
MTGWVSVLAQLVREVAVPGTGVWLIATDRPLQPLAAAIYLVMIGLLPASRLDQALSRLGGTGSSPPAAGTPPPTPSPAPDLPSP